MPLQNRGGTGGIISAIATGNATLTNINANSLKFGNGYNSTNIKLGLVADGSNDIETITIQSSRDANTTQAINSGAIPLNGLDQSTPSAATIMMIASDNDTDVGGMVGAAAVRIFGLDANWNPLIEDINLDGKNDVSTTGSFLRINQLLVLAAGSSGFNEGNISINETGHTSGNPNTEIYGTIEQFKNISTLGIFSVKAGYSFISTHYKVTADVSGKTLFAANCLKFLAIPEFVLVDLSFNNDASNFVLDGIPNVPEKSDIIIRSKLSSATGRVVIWWSGILFRHAAFPDAMYFTTSDLA